MDSVGEGEGGMFRENSIETCILSRVKQITSPGWMRETSAWAWCTGKTQSTVYLKDILSLYSHLFREQNCSSFCSKIVVALEMCHVNLPSVRDCEECIQMPRATSPKADITVSKQDGNMKSLPFWPQFS